MQTYSTSDTRRIIDGAGPDYTTDRQGWCIPMNTYDPALEPQVAMVRNAVEPQLSQMLAHMTGKDGGWYAEPEADGSAIVERRFTERLGAQYSARVWAWTVVNTDTEWVVVPNNDAATRFMVERADD